jgi:DNA (cytosine-5)-methyltransferase 1
MVIRFRRALGGEVVKNTPIIDLFSGAGGLSLGAASAGGDVRLMVDMDPRSCETLRKNSGLHKGAVLEADVEHLKGADLRKLAGLGSGDPLIIVGGAPCQPFSKAAYWVDPGEEAHFRRERAKGRRVSRPTTPPPVRPDKRRTLVEEYWRIVLECRADGFVFENVPSILHPRNKHIADALIQAANNSGYKTVLCSANAVEYGVAQRRQRVFILGLKKQAPNIPIPTHAEDPKGKGPRLPAVTAKIALAGFDKAQYFEPEELVTGRWAKHLATVPPGMNYKAHTSWAGHPRPTFVTETRFWNFLLKLSPNAPSWTIAANPGPWTGPFHWTSRRLRTPELAALQGFPPGYEFVGSRRDRVRQIGNAVPPPLACRMIGSVLDAMGTSRTRWTPTFTRNAAP